MWNEVEGSKTGQRRKSNFHPVHQGLDWPGWELCSKWCLLGCPATGCKSQALAPLSLSVTRCGHWEWYNLGLSVSLLLRQTLKEQTVGSCLYFLLLVGKSSFEGLHIYLSQPNLMTQGLTVSSSSSAVTTSCPMIRCSDSTRAQEHARNCL